MGILITRDYEGIGEDMPQLQPNDELTTEASEN